MQNELLKCTCCGGLCDWHKEHGSKAKFELTPEQIAIDWSDPPGCWSCCGSGCRSCKSTGYWSVEHAIDINNKTLETLNARLITTHKEIEERLERGKKLLELHKSNVS